MSYQACPSPDCRDVDTAALALMIEPRSRDLGGFSVRRVLPAARARLVGPFIFFDHMGPARFAPGQGLDVRPHPHIGLATVTYLFAGEILHRDSLGSVQPIRPGAVNWMTAGRGIVHSERTPAALRRAGGALHGIQSWVALPPQHEEVEPAFAHHPAGTLPRIEQDGVELTLIAGQAYGAESPARVLSPMFYVDGRLRRGAELDMPLEYPQRAVYVVDGSVSVEGRSLSAGRMAVLAEGRAVRLHSDAVSRLMLLGGAELGERHIWWNFVASSRERIERAKADWQGGRFAAVPGEVDFIPLPDR